MKAAFEINFQRSDGKEKRERDRLSFENGESSA